jgi:hypothetical protein
MKHIPAHSGAARQKSDNTGTSNSRAGVIERLFADKAWTENYQVTAEEQESLSNAAMMGEVTCERDVLFILNQLRRARLRW